MGILIGMDEAGYGPHLGPLVVAGTAWEVCDEALSPARDHILDGAVASATSAPAHHSTTALARKPRTKPRPFADEYDLYRQLRGIISKTASERRVAIADSKALYHPGQGLRQLERGLHSVLITMRQSLGRWSEMLHYCQADPDNVHHCHCWPDGHDCELPLDAPGEELARLALRLERACDAAGVRPLAIRARLIFPAQFNDLVAHYNSKGEALSNITVGLLREVVEAAIHQRGLAHFAESAEQNVPVPLRGTVEAATAAAEAASPSQPPAPSPQSPSPPPIFAVCDKHGGRNFYGALLQHHFSDHWVEAVHESHSESRYAWGPPGSRTRVKFRINGETFLPTALASMTAKYLRELAMRAFNQFWSAHVPNLRPTAGYYRDAWRFRTEIAAKQRELGIEDHVLWRTR